MFAVDRLLLVGAILLLIGIFSSKFSSRVGLPVLVLFILIGMLAGSEGIGGIAFENYTLAHGIGTVALAVILFDGGLRTSLSSFRAVLAPSVLLATMGVVFTAAITGLAASYVLGLSVLEGLLLGSIVGSTDAAAVFSVLRGKGVNLNDRLACTLEVESGSNDPMAVFLTVGLIEVLLGKMPLGPGLIGLFALQMSVGAIAGIGIGKIAVWLLNRIDLDAAGLYPVFVAAVGLLAYGLAASFQGSGFLSVYLAGIMIGNSRILFKRGIFLFHDGSAWLAQIAMFVILGLLSFPSKLIDVAGQGLLVALVLLLVARPVAVGLLLIPFRYSFREFVFLAWVGLKGAVPIVLATYPLLLGLPNAEVLFDVVFFVVLVSAITQGWSLAPLARALGLQMPAKLEPPVMLEITSLRDVDSDIVEYTVSAASRVAHRDIRSLKLPDGAVVAMVAREHSIIPPRGSTRIEPADHVFLVVRPRVRPLVDRIFSAEKGPETILPRFVEFLLRGDLSVADLEMFYGIGIDAPGSQTLSEIIHAHHPETIAPGQVVRVGDIALFAREVSGNRVEQVGLVIEGQHHQTDPH